MSLTKRSVLAPDLTVVERLQNGTGKSRPQVRDCFFSGSLESGHASLSLCDGKVVRSHTHTHTHAQIHKHARTEIGTMWGREWLQLWEENVWREKKNAILRKR